MPDNYNSISERKVAQIHALKALGYSHQDVADGLNIGKNTVARYIRETRKRVEDNGEDPFEVYAEMVEPLYTVNIEVDV
jgi:transposase